MDTLTVEKEDGEWRIIRHTGDQRTASQSYPTKAEAVEVAKHADDGTYETK